MFAEDACNFCNANTALVDEGERQMSAMFGDSFDGDVRRGGSSINDDYWRGESCIIMLSCDSSTIGCSLMEDSDWPKRTLLSFLLVTRNCEGALPSSSPFGVIVLDG